MVEGTFFSFRSNYSSSKLRWSKFSFQSPICSAWQRKVAINDCYCIFKLTYIYEYMSSRTICLRLKETMVVLNEFDSSQKLLRTLLFAHFLNAFPQLVVYFSPFRLCTPHSDASLIKYRKMKNE